MNNRLSKSFDDLDPAKEWAEWKPSVQDPFSARWAAHLYRRAGFGCTPTELNEAVKSGLEATFERMLAAPKTPLKPLPPLNTPELPAGGIQLRATWLQRMLSGIEPIAERLTFFWHNHFATSLAKIQNAKLMQRQNDLIRKHALGKFGPLLKEMSRDAAMLIWLDSNQNVKGHPNENFAREVMELFTLGVGNYTEKDVQEAARAFTGWHVTTPTDGESKFAFRESLADDLKKSDYDIGATVKRMLRSQHFFSVNAYRQKVKSPIDFILGVSRMFGTGATGSVIISPYSLIGALELQGQQLYAPPNVKGWEGGKAWLNTATVLARHNFAYEICNGMKQLNEDTSRITGQRFIPAVDPLTLHRRERLEEANKIVAFYGNLLHPGDLKPEIAAKLTNYIDKDDPENFVFEQRCRDMMYALMILPEYQLS
ncbi:MAG: DUF1800 domain-containing protein [Planctomycetes bacterium]|nr:DUF1800 domain-containing protein [Planctomycetota bacterium]